jgi:hypothetical protein
MAPDAFDNVPDKFAKYLSPNSEEFRRRYDALSD